MSLTNVSALKTRA